MSKYPYIADKKLYAAVMGACSYIRETGYFNKAVTYYADKYGVDEKDVAREIRKRQSVGQKQRNAQKPPRKYHYYAIEYSTGGERTNGCIYFEPDFAEYTVKRATSEENARAALSKNDDYSEYSEQHYFGRIKEFESKGEAENCICSWKQAKAAATFDTNENTEEEVINFFEHLKDIVRRN